MSASMFFRLLFIHLYRPFLKYNQSTSPLPSHVSPRKICTFAAAMISKLLRLYKRTHGLRQICNIAVYIAHSACTIHLLNLPDKNAKRDIVHGVKHLEEIAESWLCARRTLGILSTLARQWKVDMPEEAATILARTDAKFGAFHSNDQYSPRLDTRSPPNTQRMSPSNQDPSRNPAMDPLRDGGDFRGRVPSTKYALPSSAQPPGILTSVPIIPTGEAQRLPRQNRFELSRAQEEMWNQDVASRGSVAAAQISPSTLFGGVETLVQDNEGWWLRDQSTLASGFGNWNSMDSDLSMLGNGAPGSGYVVDGLNSYNLSEGDMYV